MAYEQQILKILTSVGERGISVSALAIHICNLNRTLFVQPDLQEVKTIVQRYLINNSKSAQSLIEHCERRGYYRLNTGNSADARQLMLMFQDEPDETPEVQETPVRQDLSLNLFEEND